MDPLTLSVRDQTRLYYTIVTRAEGPRYTPETVQALYWAINRELSDQQRTILARRFAVGPFSGQQGQTVDAVAEELALSQQEVRHIETEFTHTLLEKVRKYDQDTAFGRQTPSPS